MVRTSFSWTFFPTYARMNDNGRKNAVNWIETAATRGGRSWYLLLYVDMAVRQGAQNGYSRPWTYRHHLLTMSGVKQDPLKVLGQRIRAKRKSRGWTQEDLADIAGIDRSYIGGVERGQRNLTFKVLCQICNALGCDVAALTKGIPGAGS